MKASLSPAITRMVSLAAAMVSFQESDELMLELAGVPKASRQVERTAEALGPEIAKDERTVVETSAPCAPTLYLGMDGVPMRIGVGETPEQTARRSVQDPRGQTGNVLERRGPWQWRYAGS
jgi:hypothetical protein